MPPDATQLQDRAKGLLARVADLMREEGAPRLVHFKGRSGQLYLTRARSYLRAITVTAGTTAAHGTACCNAVSTSRERVQRPCFGRPMPCASSSHLPHRRGGPRTCRRARPRRPGSALSRLTAACPWRRPPPRRGGPPRPAGSRRRSASTSPPPRARPPAPSRRTPPAPLSYTCPRRARTASTWIHAPGAPTPASLRSPR